MAGVAWVAALGVTIGLTQVAWLFGGWGGESVLPWVNGLGFVGLAGCAAVCAGLAAHGVRGRQRAAWTSLAVGLVAWAIGDALWLYYETIGAADGLPFPSPADAAYLVYPVAACVALLLFPVAYPSRSWGRLLLEGVIVACALFEVSWILVLRSVYEAHGTRPFDAAVALAYPVTDVILVAVALMVAVRARTDQRLTLMLLVIANMLNAVSDSAFAYLIAVDRYVSGHPVDLGWSAALLTIMAAAVVGRRASQTQEEEPRSAPRISLWLPYLPLVLVALVSFPAFSHDPDLAPMLVGLVLLVGAVLARQYLVVRENRQLLNAMADQALRDPLTGLANRALFQDRLSHAMQLHERDHGAVSVMSVDLDDFKLINDNMGHPAGDEALVLAARRLLGCVRAGDTVARIGGDEFAVLIEGNPADARAIAYQMVRAFDEPFVIDGHELSLRLSVGLAVAREGVADMSAGELLKQADVAMYSAKRSRSGGWHTFTPEVHRIEPEVSGPIDDTTPQSARAGAVRMLGQLRRAIDNVDLILVYQPKYHLQSEQIVGVEALVRWPHPEHGLLGPDEFLPLVREHGLMRALTELVLNQALDDAARWRADGVEVPVAVNVFAPSLADLDLPAQVSRALTDRGLTSDVLTVEITEDLLPGDMDCTRTVVDTLRERGIRVAIDDFGNGYAALSYLRDLPVDEVKLDREFIAPILADARTAAIVKSVIELAYALGVTTVAEGVEDAATAAKLRAFGCAVAQGFYYSPPVAAADIASAIAGYAGTSRSEIELMQ